MTKGVGLSLLSTAIFAGLYYYATLLYPLTGEQIFAWRILLTFPLVTAFLVLSRQWSSILAIARRVRARPPLIFGLLLSSVLLAAQQWLFLWAPVNGRALQVSLGYFLMPLGMVLVGRLVYRERIATLQWIAVGSASLGVAHELARVGGFSWEAAAVAVGFPAYFVLRRKLLTHSLGGLWFDMLLVLPITVLLLLRDRNSLLAFIEHPRLFGLVPVLALLSAAGFMSYSVANRLLPLSLFGLLGYVEPVLMVAVSLLVGETIGADQLLTYIPIWVAVGLLALHGIRQLRPPWAAHRRDCPPVRKR